MQSEELFDVIPNDPDVSLVVYDPRFSAVCSEGNAPFGGTLVIQMRPGDYLLEFESFEDWLGQIANVETTIEGFCRLVFGALRDVVQPMHLLVEVRATTIRHAPVSAVIEGVAVEEGGFQEL